MTNNSRILVTGGTGKTGRRIAKRLADSGRTARIASRHSEQRFDWNDRHTWPGALEGVGAAYIAYYPDLAFPGAAETLGAFAEMGVRAGVERFVLLSGRGEPGAEASEVELCAAAPHWTVVRSSFFCQNFSEHFLLGPVLAGVIALPAGDVGEPFVDAEDVAEVAVAALTESSHNHCIYELTGPRLLSFAEVSAELSQVTGRTIAYQPVTVREYVEMAVAHGMAVEEAEPLAQLFSEVLDGRNAHVTDDISRVLAKPASDFGCYARATASTGIWDIGKPHREPGAGGSLATTMAAPDSSCSK